MWEHEDEYFDGKGKKQENFVRDEELKGLPQAAGASMIWTDPTHGLRHIIGNRFDVQKARKALDDLRPALAVAHSRMRLVRDAVTASQQRPGASTQGNVSVKRLREHPAQGS